MKIQIAPGAERHLKKFKKKAPNIYDRFWNQMVVFEKNPFDQKLDNHSLGGNLSGMRSVRITDDIRAVYRMDDGTAVFLRVGGHGVAYR